MVKKAKFRITQWLGYMFCEFSFRWFNVVDVPVSDDCWKWYHHAIFFIGSKSYLTGCYFYNIGDFNKFDSGEDISESR